MAADDPVFSLPERPVHLGLGARVVPQPPFTGIEWYDGYIERHAADGDEGRLVSMYTFTEGWDSWEMHPHGEELVVCLDGEMTLHQELDGVTTTVTLGAGDAVVNPPGAWHIADVEGTARALFITSGRGTEMRPR